MYVATHPDPLLQAVFSYPMPYVSEAVLLLLSLRLPGEHHCQSRTSTIPVPIEPTIAWQRR